MHYMGFTRGTLTHWDKANMIGELFTYWMDIVFPVFFTSLIADFFLYCLFSWIFIGPWCAWFKDAFNRDDINCTDHTATVFIDFILL